MSTDVKNHVISTLNEEITSPFGMRADPKTGLDKMHYGIDIVDKGGLHHTTAVGITAIADGEVVAVTSTAERGFYVDILHSGSIVTRYQHLASQGVNVGDTLSKGDLLGVMGETGKSDGIHLHFETIENCVLGADGKYTGTVVDPMPYLTEEGKIKPMPAGEVTINVSTSDGSPLNGLYMNDKASYPLQDSNNSIVLNRDIGVSHTVSFEPKEGYAKPLDFGYLTSSTPQQFNKVYEKGEIPETDPKYFIFKSTNGVLMELIQDLANQDNITQIKTPCIVNGIKVTGVAGIQRYNLLTDLIVSEGIKIVYNSCCYGSSKLTNVVFPSTLDDIQMYAFTYCDLRTVNIPNSVKTIGTDAFRDNNNMVAINIYKAANSIAGAPWGATNATVNWLG